MATALVVWAYATAYITFGIGLLSFVARFVSRGLALGLWGWDDTASCFVMVCQEFSLTGPVGAYHVRLLALSIKSLYNYSLIWGAASKSNASLSCKLIC